MSAAGTLTPPRSVASATDIVVAGGERPRTRQSHAEDVALHLAVDPQSVRDTDVTRDVDSCRDQAGEAGYVDWRARLSMKH
jgi:hypothetical protein